MNLRSNSTAIIRQNAGLHQEIEKQKRLIDTLIQRVETLENENDELRRIIANQERDDASP